MILEDNLDILIDNELGQLEMLFTNHNLIYYEFCFNPEILN